jgi:NodT family efflux transporter outer membrane factor (OMF) lipoprotein
LDTCAAAPITATELSNAARLRQEVNPDAADASCMLRYRSRALAGVFCAALGACSLAPPYQIPSVPAPPAYRGVTDWKIAQPADALGRGAWWRIYQDPGLDTLEMRVDNANQELKVGFARLEQARDQTRIARAAYFPVVSAAASGQHYRNSLYAPTHSPATPTVTNDLLLNSDVSYEADLWGRIHNSVAAAHLTEQAGTADFSSLSLAIHAELASDYFVLRGADTEQEILDQTVTEYARALALTRSLHEGGLAALADVDQAKAQLETAKTKAAATHLLRAQTEHAIAVLLGESASNFRLDPKPFSLEMAPPAIDPGVPSALLERRPDIAAAERLVAAANAEIGVARAAYFPVFDLMAAAGFESTEPLSWVTAPARMWSLGPAAALTLFDGGRRHAQVAESRAEYDEQVAEYRGVVLDAYQEVEDSLSALHDLDLESTSEAAALQSTGSALKQAQYQYQMGLVTYLQVVVTENATLSARLAVADIQIRRMSASVLLVKALGGGWDHGSLPR